MEAKFTDYSVKPLRAVDRSGRAPLNVVKMSALRRPAYNAPKLLKIQTTTLNTT